MGCTSHSPFKAVPHDWFGNLKDKKILGLASGGGQQIPIFSALGAKCTVLDYSGEQCEREREIAKREGYDVEIFQFDMTRKLPFDDEGKLHEYNIPSFLATSAIKS